MAWDLNVAWAKLFVLVTDARRDKPVMLAQYVEGQAACQGRGGPIL